MILIDTGPFVVAEPSLIVAADSLRTAKVFMLDRTDFRTYRIPVDTAILKRDSGVGSYGQRSKVARA